MSTQEALLITLALPNPTEMETMGHYAERSFALASEYGAKVLARFSVTEHLYGTVPTAIVGIARFPSVETIKEMFDSDAYAPLIPHREKAIKVLNVYISQPNVSVEIEPNPDKAHLITLATQNMNDKDALQAYQQQAGPLAGKYGAKPIAQIGIGETYFGSHQAGFLSLAEFPNEDDIQGLFNDGDYQSLGTLRDKALSSLNLYVAK